MLFYRYISENLKAYLNRRMVEAGFEGFDFMSMSDKKAEAAREEMVSTKGDILPNLELFKILM